MNVLVFHCRIDRPPTSIRFALALGLLIALSGPSLNGLSANAAEETDAIVRGEAIYREACVQCHGKEGEGVEEFYPDPLVGDATIGELAELISDTMPEEEPDKCVAEDAVAVATYIHHDFYSEAAQVRRRPPRVSLARLTGEQLRQSLADLFGRISGSPWAEDRHGLEGTYFADSHWKDDKKKIERVDPTIDFDFGKEGPGEGIEPDEFYIHWSGSLKVEKTGRYEIILRSTCSCKLDFGGRERTLIDNHVQSEGKEEFRRTLQLTGGRCYPIKLEFTQRKRKTEQPAAKVSLSWIAPGGVEEIIPADRLIPSALPSAFALQSKLPPDDRSYGYERGTAINRVWEDSTTTAALEFAQFASSELFPMYQRKHKKDSNDNRAIVRDFLTELVETAFRGPLSDPMRDLYINRQVDRCPDDAEAIKQAVLISLKSPRFLYPSLDGDRSTSQRAANRLALTLFDSLPSDDWLMKAIEKGQLKDQKELEKAAWNMVGDVRCEAKTKSLIYTWLDIADTEEITKDGEAYPGFDASLVSDLRKSLDHFIDEVIESDTSDFRQLIQADWTYTTPRLAAFYGDAWKAADEKSDNDGKSENADQMQRSVSDATIHVGVLTHPLLMSDLAYHRTTSPIHRGVFLTRHVLGRVLRPPNAAFSPINPDLHPGLTTRQRVELQTGEVSCQVCHEKINALGFALENFDATGAFRKLENEKPIDTSGGYLTRNGDTATFNGARELGDFLAGSEDCHRSFVETAFEHFVKQPIAAFGVDRSDQLTREFQNNDFNVRQLIVSIAVIAAQQKQESVPGA